MMSEDDDFIEVEDFEVAGRMHKVPSYMAPAEHDGGPYLRPDMAKDEAEYVRRSWRLDEAQRDQPFVMAALARLDKKYQKLLKSLTDTDIDKMNGAQAKLILKALCAETHNSGLPKSIRDRFIYRMHRELELRAKRNGEFWNKQDTSAAICAADITGFPHENSIKTLLSTPQEHPIPTVLGEYQQQD